MNLFLKLSSRRESLKRALFSFTTLNPHRDGSLSCAQWGPCVLPLWSLGTTSYEDGIFPCGSDVTSSSSLCTVWFVMNMHFVHWMICWIMPTPEVPFAAGTLATRNHCLDCCKKVKDSPPYLAVASYTSGSTPQDQFEDVAEEIEKQYHGKSGRQSRGVERRGMQYPLLLPTRMWSACAESRGTSFPPLNRRRRVVSRRTTSLPVVAADPKSISSCPSSMTVLFTCRMSDLFLRLCLVIRRRFIWRWWEESVWANALGSIASCECAGEGLYDWRGSSLEGIWVLNGTWEGLELGWGWCEEVESVEHSRLVSPCLDGSGLNIRTLEAEKYSIEMGINRVTSGVLPMTFISMYKAITIGGVAYSCWCR